MGNDLKTWVEALVERQGTVLHLVPGRVPLARVDGRLEPLGEQPLDTQTFVQALHAVCGEDAEAGVLHAAAAGGQMLHGRLVRDAGRRTLVIRRLVTPATDREQVGLSDDVWNRFGALKRGLVLVTGAPDSGKSATCAALVASRLADAGAHAMITGEPLTWRLPSHSDRSRVSHRIVGVDSEDAVGAITQALEQDADVACCDPVVESWTGAALPAAAADGALVVASVTAASVPDAIHRLCDSPNWRRDIVTRNLSQSVELVLHQALVERADGSGRVLAFGVMTKTPAIHNLLREDRPHQLTAMMMTGAKWGMRSLEQHLQTLVEDGTVTREAAEAAHPQPWMLRDWLDRATPNTPPAPPA